MSKKIFVDLDNTICNTISNDYLNSTPIKERVDFFNNLKEQGNTIIIWTARGSRSGIDYSEITKNQLDEWGVKYDDILMKKPDYDVYYDDKSFNIDTILPLPKHDVSSNITKKLQTEIVKKGWGKEIIFVNNDEYCGKILSFEKGKKFSMHYHLKKKETWYVSKGRFILIWVETENGVTHVEYLNVGDVITNERGEPHQLIALEDSDVFEVSTKHYDEDSFRMWKGD
jgi:mannose-6-phosphate isomerase-like protein (cupin superfamily)